MDKVFLVFDNSNRVFTWTAFASENDAGAFVDKVSVLLAEKLHERLKLDNEGNGKVIPTVEDLLESTNFLNILAMPISDVNSATEMFTRFFPRFLNELSNLN